MAGKSGSGPLQSVGVIGAGAWGTALAQSLRMAGRDVVIWARDAAVVDGINRRHINERRLPGYALDPALLAISAIEAAAARDFLLLAVPAQQVRSACETLKPHWRAGRPLVICAKGLEQGTDKFVAAVAAEVLDGTAAVLSGPSFAADVARGLPTAVTLAASSLDEAKQLAAAVGHRTFRIYSSDDLAGVQLGGAVKNVLAIAAGILTGRGLGASAHAALVTRAFAELSRFGLAYGARRETLTGLSCLGDLILTCNSPQSRNFTLGRHLGEGRTLAEALTATGGTVEGVATAAVVGRMANHARPKLDMPIASAVHRIVSGQLSVDNAIGELLSRPQKAES
jgi:glycerol-3-phosphate dehydrogenase (NAD(P)+)